MTDSNVQTPTQPRSEADLSAALYRRLDRNQRKSNMVVAIPLAVIVLAGVGAYLAYQAATHHPAPAAATQTASAAASIAPPAPSTPTPSS